MNLMLSGHCHREKDADPAEAKAIHDLCHGVYKRNGGGYYRCPCNRHQGENRCRICRYDHRDNIDGFDIANARCADYDACTRRLSPESQKVYREVTTIRTAATSSTRAKSPRDCECGCGGQTRGGRFQPGHDAKLKGVLLGRAKGGDEEAHAELVRRRWVKS